jgi:hypothetical protein
MKLFLKRTSKRARFGFLSSSFCLGILFLGLPLHPTNLFFNYLLQLRVGSKLLVDFLSYPLVFFPVGRSNRLD